MSRPAPDIPGRCAAGTLASPEFPLVAACCRWPPSQSRHAAVQAAAAPIADWNAVVLAARRQRVVGLVYDALQAAGVPLPAAPAAEFARRAQAISRKNLLLAAETCRLQELLDTAEVPSVALKGVALAQLAYGSLKVKHTLDIDLLVSPERALAAMALLERNGYALSFPSDRLSAPQRRAVMRYSREVAFIHPGHGTLTELQWRVADNPKLLEEVHAGSPTQNVVVADGLSIRTLARDDLFAYLCIHGAHHAWSRLKWLADLNAFIAATDVVHLHRYAQAKGAGFCSGQALLLCQRLFALPLPDGLASELQGTARVRKLYAIAADAMADRARGDAPAAWRSFWTQFLLGRGWAFFAAQCRTASVGIIDVISLPLPPYLHFLYPLLRLPLWLWRRAAGPAPPGPSR
ncbi:MAG: nucleotidyltransferase family protein [Xanthobacteraceae bacterium]